MAVDFFFYGTLRDGEVQRIVFGPGALPPSAEPATLEGYRCAPVERGRFPAIRAERGATTHGVLLRSASLDAAARVSYFEGDGTDYEIVRRPVAIVGGTQRRAWIFLPTAALPVESGEWRFEFWQRQWRPAFLMNARAAMARPVPAELNRYRRIWLGRLSRVSEP